MTASSRNLPLQDTECRHGYDCLLSVSSKEKITHNTRLDCMSSTPDRVGERDKKAVEHSL